jgi:gliding motility-associated-like protein
MMQKWILIFFYVIPAGLFNFLFSQTNMDTPNLSLEAGNLAGWRQYLGAFYYDKGDGQYKYDDWTEVTVTPNIQIINGFADQQDPVISCWNFPTNPDGITPVRIGIPNTAEYLNTNSAMAERLSYTFLVTENTTLFTYKFATVLHVPELSGQSSNPHTGEQLPLFSLEIEIEDTITGLITRLPCGFFEVSADIHSTYGLTQVPANAYCPSSIANTVQNPNRIREYAYRNWTTGSYNLSAQIGKRVTISILTHDCLVPIGNNNIQAGSHSAHGYFWAETRKMELIVKNCGLEDAIITAPDGFAVYEWVRSDGILVGTDPNNPAVAIIPPELIKAGVIYSCKLHSDITACDPITLSTELEEVGVNIQFDYQNNCSGVVDFTNKTVIDNDYIIGYQWNFGDGGVSYMENPSHNYSSPGEYNVSLTISTNLGCKQTKMQKITVRYFPNLQIIGSDSVCVGETFELAVLEAGVGSLFEWNTGSTEQSIKEVAVSSGSYTVKVTDPFTCSYQKSFWVTVKPSANFYIQGLTEVCMNDTVFLSARSYAINDNIQYIWNDGTYGADLKARPLINGIVYSVTGTYMNGCQTTKNVPITVNPLPVVTLTGESSICKGEAATLTAQGGSTYNWPDLYSGSTRVVIPDSTTIYSVIGIDTKECFSLPATKKVIVKELPVLSVTGDSTVCEGKTVILTAQGASTYSWHDGSTTRTFSRVVTQDTTFWFEGNLNGCFARREIPIRALPLPYVRIDGNPTICRNQTVTLTGKGADSYYWNTGSTNEMITETPLFTSSYQLTGTALNGCSRTETIQVTVNPLPNVRITGDKDACQNTSVNLKVEGASDYYWDNGAYGDNILLMITDTITFSVRGVDKNRCENTASWTVNSIPPPVVEYMGKTEICLGESTTLVGSGGMSYVWSDTVFSSSLRLTPSENMLIRLTGIYMNCPATIMIPITVLTPPTLYISGGMEVCYGEPFTLYVSGAGEYKWNTGDETNTITYSPASTTEYIVTGTNANGCFSTAKETVTVHPLPEIRIMKGKQTGCPGGRDTIRLTATGAISYQWSSEPYNYEIALNGSKPELIARIGEGETIVYVEGKDGFGCIGNTQITVVEQPREQLSFEVSPAFIEKGSSNVRFTGISPVNSTWYWDAGDNSPERKGNNIGYSYSLESADSFIVSVRAVNELGCEYTGTTAVFVWKDFWAPTAFSPNKNDLNDNFRFFGGEMIDDFTYIIYNRLGEIVFTGESIYDQWDGTYRGDPCPWGIYGWVAQYKSNFLGVPKSGEKKGFVTLVR